MKPRPLPDLSYVAEALAYDAETGVFVWRQRPEAHFSRALACFRWNAKWAGKIAGNIKPDGYRIILLAYQPYLAHRLAWLLAHGEQVQYPNELDHINGNRADNRIANLRAVSHTNNMANKKLHHNSRTGVRGVSLHRDGKFRASIGRNYQEHYLGLFATLEEAAAARREAEQRLQGAFARKTED